MGALHILVKLVGMDEKGDLHKRDLGYTEKHIDMFAMYKKLLHGMTTSLGFLGSEIGAIVLRHRYMDRSITICLEGAIYGRC